ncbi:MAG TPA: MATE family efflux transporter [Candidatus Limiplasma sp.]|nr:MATE family efflux transporter [Candidatus Limiplasma sp.]HPS80779.1 MATE family efflux transporter [Candidatus Limiplasma sp.]
MHKIASGFKRFFAPRDMTVGKPMTELIMFSVPLLLGNFAQQMYNTVDAIVVGNYVGDNALGAVGLSNSVLNLMLSLFMGLATGAGIVVSQYFGAKDRAALSRSVGTIIVLTFWAGLITTVVGVLASRPLLVLIGTPPEMLDMTATYLEVIFAGIIGCAYYNILGGVLRGLGDSFSPLVYLLLATVINIVLDIVFVTAFHMTTDGVALATIIAQGISAVFCYRRLTRMTDVLEVNRHTLKIDRAIAERTVRLGLPAGLTQAIFSLQAVIVQSLMNSLGPLVVTTFTAVMRVDGFAMMPNFTFGIAATTFSGQNYGARRLDRIQEGSRDALRLAIVCSSILTGCILLFGRQLMGVFTQTEAIVNLGVRMMRILAFGYIAFSVTQTLSGIMRGLNETVIPMWISLITTFVIRMPLAYLFAYLTRSVQWPNGDPSSLYWSLLIAWVCGGIITTLVYQKGKWRKRALDGLKEPFTAPEAQAGTGA